MTDVVEEGTAAQPAERPVTGTPVRWTAIVFALIIGAIVWMNYHYTGALVADALELLTTAEDAPAVKDGVIQLLSAVAQSMVAVAAVTGLVGATTKLCER